MPDWISEPCDPWLPERAKRSPCDPAIFFDDEVISFAELDRRAGVIASHLFELGISAGDRIAIAAQPTPRFVVLLHAVQRLGAAIVPLNTRLTTAEASWQIADADPQLVLFDESCRALIEQRISAVALESFDKQDEASVFPPEQIDPEAILTILYTSGTTGSPKGAMISNRAHLASATASRRNLGVQPNDRWLCTLPLYHVGGLSIFVRSVIDGLPVVLHPRFEPARAVHAIREQGITLVSVVATMLIRMLDAGLDEPHRLRAMLAGGGPIPAPLIDRALTAGLPLLPTYGLTETASQVVTTPAGEKPIAASAGRPLPGIRLQIDAPSHDGSGEILIGGPTNFSGYFRRPDKTAAVLRDPWLHTGDIGRLDDDSNLFVLDRRSDLIITGGENVYPAEIEAVLITHPDIAEVAIWGETDTAWGEHVAAAIVLHSGGTGDPEEIAAWCTERLARFKIPRTFRFVAELPRTASGKVQRHRLRELKTQR